MNTIWDNFLLLVFVLISVTINFIFLNYVDKLEKMNCKCADSWKKTFIQIYSTIVIVFQVTMLLGSYSTISKIMIQNRKKILFLLSVYQIGGIVYIYTLYSYSKNLKKISCQCADKWERTLMYNYSLIALIAYVSIFILNFIIMLLAMYITKTL
jgi:hypothetical protein